MNLTFKRPNGMEPYHTGYLGTSRVVFNHYDVSTQADIQHTTLTYSSEDELTGRLQHLHHHPQHPQNSSSSSSRASSASRVATPHYSKQDILEQYCISDRGFGALDDDGGGEGGGGGGGGALFGCLSSHHGGSPCSARGSSLLTACVRQKAPSDENIYELYRRHPAEYAPYPRRNRNPWGPVASDMYYDEDLKSSYFRRKIIMDPSRYTWMPSDDESVRMEKPRPIIETNHHYPSTPQMNLSSNTLPGKKHVSFARSHTMASFDDAITTLSSSTGQLNRIARSQERLLDVRKTDLQPITKQPEAENKFLDKIKRAQTPMKTQATQTEIGLGRKPIPPNHINLSPRTIHRVKMVSQGAQTNGLVLNGRKLIKSYSEAGNKFDYNNPDGVNFENHEPLQRTQSDEPPRSPFIVDPPPCFSGNDHQRIDYQNEAQLMENNQQFEQNVEQNQQSETSSLSNLESEDSMAESKKEIFIDFKPQISPTVSAKRTLTKTMSDGEILLEQRKAAAVSFSSTGDDGVVPEKPTISLSHENLHTEHDLEVETCERSFVPYFQNSPIRNEGIFVPFGGGNKNIGNNMNNIYSSLDVSVYGQDSIDEEFHENIIYNKIYLDRQDSEGEEVGRLLPCEEGVVPSVCLVPEEKSSPFASNDSLTNDTRDQSDEGIWNESQATVLQADSGTENGTALSSSEVTTAATSPGSAGSLLLLMTPSSRRKHLLLLQHQQRSSMDTEALDEDQEEADNPKVVVEKAAINPTEPPSRRQFLSLPTWRTRTNSTAVSVATLASESSLAESPLPAVVPDLLLARTDSCKTNTDISESTTTDDYITANSGTDSSRRSGSIMGMEMYGDNPLIRLHLQTDGSSLDSTKGFDLLTTPSNIAVDDMVVPSFSPSPVHQHHQRHHRRDQFGSPTSPRSLTPVPLRDRSTPSEESSSSCGSYSVAGSTPDLLEAATASDGSPVAGGGGRGGGKRQHHHHHHHRHRSRQSEDEEQASISTTRKSSRYQSSHKQRRKEFTLDLANHTKSYLETYSFSTNGKFKSPKRADHSKKHSPAGSSGEIATTSTTIATDGAAINEKPKRGKSSRMRSPMQNHKLKKSAYFEEKENKGTSDESSCDLGVTRSNNQQHHHHHHHHQIVGQNSPRKGKKCKEGGGRRKSLPRSPVSQRNSNRNEEEKPSSLPGSLSRTKPTKQTMPATKDGQNKRYSPIGSPSTGKATHPSVDTTKLKALSAESLRSVSPGSDSVFYSDPSSHAAAHDQHHVHCLHCGKEVDIVTTDDPDKSVSSNDTQQDIVQPPAGFEDSPRSKTKERLFKKLDRRIRSEERNLAENRKHRYKQDVRAKSEERAAKTYRSKLRPMAKSTTSSQEHLKSTDSSPSVLPGEPEEEDDTGVYDVPYNDGSWIYVDERDEIGKTSYSSPNEYEPSTRRESMTSTESEQEFRKKYESVTHRMVHRKSCLEMYKRQNSRSFECDKTVTVHRERGGEFGFRIHGSKPVVVSAIEPGTPAESSGLEVGDIVLAVNGVSVLDKTHSEVVKIAHAGSDVLNLEVARTCYALSPPRDDYSSNTLYNGYLWKLSGYASGVTTNRWIRRWFCLKQSNCLYYYKTDNDKQPVGVVMLFDHMVQTLADNEDGLSKQFRFVIQRPDSVPLHLAADTSTAQNRWIDVIGKAINDSQIVDDFLETTKRYLLLSPNNIPQPDCFGYLVKLGTQWKSWSRRYCVLKDACLYFYQDANTKSAFGVAYLHGYRVQQSLSGSKKHTFEIIPPDSGKKHYYFHTESDADRKRWIAALEYSIDRWFKIQ